MGTRIKIRVAGLLATAIALLLSWPGTAAAQIVCATGSTLEGVDVSSYNSAIDWTQVAGSGRSFALIRLGEGTASIDPLFASNYAAAKAAGLIRGAYLYFRAGMDATAQANVVINTLGSLAAGDLPPILDVEVTDGQSPATIAAALQTTAGLIQQGLGVAPIIYTAPGFWTLAVGPAGNTLQSNLLDVSSWGVICPAVPSGWSTWLFWQYSGSGSVPGIATSPVDLDRFNGSLTLLRQLAGVNGRDTTPPAISPLVTGTQGALGWYSGTVGLSWTVTDNESPIVASSGCATLPALPDTPAAGQTWTCTATSLGGTSTQSINLLHDSTPPTIALAAPADQSSFPAGFAVSAQYGCTDALSGLLPGSCVGDAPSGTPIDTTVPGPRTFTVSAQDIAGNLASLTAHWNVSALTFTTPGSIWTLAGYGQPGYSGDGGPGYVASLAAPLKQFAMSPAGVFALISGIVADDRGNVYFSDTQNHRVRRVDAATGQITTVAGTGTATYDADQVPAGQASLNTPGGLALDKTGNLFIADTGNGRVRRVDTNGVITTVAGGGMDGSDGIAALQAALASPVAVTVDATGNLYVADAGPNLVRRIDAATQLIATVAGSSGGMGQMGQMGQSTLSGDGGPATQASLSFPSALAVDSAGNLFIADAGNHSVRRVAATNSIITTVAGNGTAGSSGDGGVATAAQLSTPYGLALDGGGNLYISDAASNALRRVDAQTQIISTIAGGNGVEAFTGDGGLAAQATLSFPGGVALNAAGNLFFSDGDAYRIRTIAGAGANAVADTTPPAIAASVVGTAGNNGWYVSAVAVTWAVSDPESAISTRSGCDPVTITADTGPAGQVLTCTATSAGGTATQSVTIKRDATPPVATATPSPMPNGYGWNNTAVTVHFSATDGASGIAGCSPDVQVSSEGASQSSPAGTCMDNAGNVSAPVSAQGINIDKTAPVASGKATPAANPAGWNNTPVTVNFTATDSLSGVTPTACSPSSAVLSSQGTGLSAGSTCSDRAGNTAAASVSDLRIDTQPPVAVATLSPSANAAGWNNSNVTVSFSATDGMSGSGVAGCSASVSLTSEVTGQLVSGTCTDVAGNVSAPTSATVNLDKTPPTISIASPANGASYVTGSTVAANYSCTDARSGVASCSASVPNGAAIDTSATGNKTFSVSSADVAGNTAVASVGYTVVAAAPGFSLSPAALAFGPEPLNSVTSLTVTLTSTGTVPLTLTQIAIAGGNTGQFSQSNTCASTLAIGASCAISVSFRPTSSGLKASTLSVTAAGGAGTKAVALSGTGVIAAFTLTPATVPFADEPVGLTSAAQSLTVSNTGVVPVPLNGLSIAGTNANQFLQTNTCGTSIAVGAACTVAVVFRPSTAGSKVASLTVSAGGGAGAKSAALTGSGVVPTYALAWPGSPGPLAFGTQARNTSSSAALISVSNTSNLSLPVSGIVLGGNNPGQFSQSNTCGSAVAAGASCTVSVVFRPTSTGAKSAEVRLSFGGGAASPVRIALTGTGY